MVSTTSKSTITCAKKIMSRLVSKCRRSDEANLFNPFENFTHRLYTFQKFSRLRRERREQKLIEEGNSMLQQLYDQMENEKNMIFASVKAEYDQVENERNEIFAAGKAEYDQKMAIQKAGKALFKDKEELETKLAERDGELEACEDEKEELRTLWFEARGEVEATKRAEEKLRGELRRTQGKLKRTERQLKRKDRQLAAEVKCQSEKLRTEEEHVARHTALLGERDSVINALSTEVQELRAALQAKDQETSTQVEPLRSEALEEVRRREAQLSAMRAQQEEKDSANNALSHQVEQLTASLHSKGKELQQAHQTQQQWREQAATFEKQAEKDRESLTAARDQTLAEKAELAEKVEFFESYTAEIRKRLFEAQEEAIDKHLDEIARKEVVKDLIREKEQAAAEQEKQYEQGVEDGARAYAKVEEEEEDGGADLFADLNFGGGEDEADAMKDEADVQAPSSCAPQSSRRSEPPQPTRRSARLQPQRGATSRGGVVDGGVKKVRAEQSARKKERERKEQERRRRWDSEGENDGLMSLFAVPSAAGNG